MTRDEERAARIEAERAASADTKPEPVKSRTGFTRENAWLTDTALTATGSASLETYDLGTPRAVLLQAVQFQVILSAVAGNRQMIVTLLRGDVELLQVQSQQTLGANLNSVLWFTLKGGQEMQGNDIWTVPLPEVIGIQADTLVMEIGGAQAGDVILPLQASFWLWN